MSIDIAALKRRCKPERQVRQFVRRSGEALVSAASATGLRRVLVDTTVYIHEVAGTLPADATRLLDGALRFHSAFCIAEIVSSLCDLHPGSRYFDPAREYYRRLFSSISRHRLLTPDADILAQAAVVSGTLARTQGYARRDRKELFNDAVIYLTAARLGVPLLTANRDDFDLIQQAAEWGMFIYYVAADQ
nr:PIN domain-containing protein [uncultured Rhodopila sp.]